MTFDTAFDRLLGHEGGYTNDPNDPGGETNWGISKREYPSLDIKKLTREQAKAIYLRDFWNKINADKLPNGIVFQLFDFATNSGVQTAIRYFQRALGVADDGVIGPVTSHAMLVTSETDMIMQLNAERLDYMTKLVTWPKFGRGWAKRIAQNLRYGSLDS